MLTMDYYRTGNAHTAIDNIPWLLEIISSVRHLLHDDLLYPTLRLFIYLFKIRICSISRVVLIARRYGWHAV
jgi:hypothetical protein